MGLSTHVRARGAHVELHRIHFTGGRSATDGGSFVLNASYIKMSKCRVCSSSTGKHGGAIYAAGGSLHVEECAFVDNVAAGGGGSISASEEATLVVRNSTFSNCKAGTFGGAIGLFNGSNLHLAGAALRDSTAGSAGGSIYHSGQNLHIDQVEIENCSAGKGGGIGHISSIHISSELRITSCTASKGDGGGLMSFGGSARLSIAARGNVLVEKCAASRNGGGISLQYAAQILAGPRESQAAAALQTPALTLRQNVAGRFGGGLFKEGCDHGLEEQGLCWIGNIAASGASSNLEVKIDSNEAAVAGGGAFTSCHLLGACGRLFDSLAAARSTHVRGVVTFIGNSAAAYGPELASGPASIMTSKSLLPHIPGQSRIDTKIALLDARGQTVTTILGQRVSYTVKGVISPVDMVCRTLSECCKSALQPVMLWSVDGTQTTDLEPILPQLAYCPTGATHVMIHLFLSHSEDFPPHSFQLACGMCSSNQKMRTKMLGSTATYTCEQCDKQQYIVDPTNPNHQCQPRARGMINMVSGSKWSQSGDGDTLRLTECPAGFLIKRREDSKEDDECVPCGNNSYSLGVKTSSAMATELQICIACPTGATCDGIPGVAVPVVPRAGYWAGKPAKCFPKESKLKMMTEFVETFNFADDCSVAPLVERRQEGTNQTCQHVKIARIYRCHPSEACEEYNGSKTNGEASCRQGHSGVACSQCKPGWQVFFPGPYAFCGSTCIVSLGQVSY